METENETVFNNDFDSAVLLPLLETLKVREMMMFGLEIGDG